MPLAHDYATLAEELTSCLGLEAPPLAITFCYTDNSTPRYASTMPSPQADGRTGAVPAGCVFWMEATEKVFSTLEQDHGNCSVGSFTHGFKTLEQVADHLDVKALVESGWVTPEAVGKIASVRDKPRSIVYGPLKQTENDPDVVLLRLNAKQAMIFHDSIPDVRIEGKPQCHIVAIAKEFQQPALSVGCMLSRVRTGMKSSELTCALPAAKLSHIVDRIKVNAATDRTVAAYAADDVSRFH